MGNLSAIKINDGLIRINERNEQGLNVDAWLVLGNEKAVLIDAVQDTILLHEMVTSLTHLPLEVIITHGHPDHAGKGLRAFMEHGVPVYIHPDDKPLLQKRNLFTTEETEQMLSLTEGMQFELGNRTLEILECAGHTPDGANARRGHRRQCPSPHGIPRSAPVFSGCSWKKVLKCMLLLKTFCISNRI